LHRRTKLSQIAAGGGRAGDAQLEAVVGEAQPHVDLGGETSATVPGREPIYCPVANPEASFAAADGALKSMTGPAERIALLFGWRVPGRGEEVSAAID
jgi:hypothetical protein